MKKTLLAFRPFLAEITHDFMLIACIVGPILMGMAFCFGIPPLEILLCNYFNVSAILSPYYIIFDLLLSIMTPILFSFAGVLVILDEIDCGMAKYYGVTPVGKSGYLASRISVPSLLALVYNITLLKIFSLSKISLLFCILLSISGTLLAIITALFVVAFAKNKIEGMALVKLCGLLILGVPASYFILEPIRYLFGILPSFWIAEFCATGNYWYFFVTVILCGFYIAALYGKFKRKLQ